MFPLSRQSLIPRTCQLNTHAGKFVRAEQVFNCGSEKYDRHKNNENQNTSDHGNLQIIIFTLDDNGWEKKTPPPRGEFWTGQVDRLLEPLHILPHLTPGLARLAADIQAGMAGTFLISDAVAIGNCPGKLTGGEEIFCVAAIEANHDHGFGFRVASTPT